MWGTGVQKSYSLGNYRKTTLSFTFCQVLYCELVMSNLNKCFFNKKIRVLEFEREIKFLQETLFSELINFSLAILFVKNCLHASTEQYRYTHTDRGGTDPLEISCVLFTAQTYREVL